MIHAIEYSAAQNKRLERTRRLATSIRSCVGEPLKRNVRQLAVSKYGLIIDECIILDSEDYLLRAVSGRARADLTKSRQ